MWTSKFLRVYPMPINIYISTEKVCIDIFCVCMYIYVYTYTHTHTQLWIYFGQLCVKSSSWPFSLNNSTVSRGFSETEIAIYSMWCMKQFKAFIPLHWKWRFTILTFSRHLCGVKLCPSIINSSSLLSLSFSIFKSHFKYSTKYLASLGIKAANLCSFFSPPLHGDNNTCLTHKDIVRHNIL